MCFLVEVLGIVVGFFDEVAAGFVLAVTMVGIGIDVDGKPWTEQFFRGGFGLWINVFTLYLRSFCYYPCTFYC